MHHYDTIIIGSGAGGLSTALCLVRAGQRVLVLEQHEVPGGWCHSFYLHGQRFSPGVHYVGMLQPHEPFSELYENLGIANDLEFFRMQPAGFERCWIGDARIDMPAGIDALCDALGQRFPDERHRLRKYLHLVKEVSRQLQTIPRTSGFRAHALLPFRTRLVSRYALRSLKSVLELHIRDPLLRKVLSVQCGDHGLPPSRVSFVLHSAIMDHYFSGGFYPAGGGAAIVKALTNAIRAGGGEIRTGQLVTRICVAGSRRRRATGVQLAGGKIITAAQVVSNADPARTYTELIGQQHLSRSLRRKLRKTRYSVGSLSLFLIVDADVAAAGMNSGNIWMSRDGDLDALFVELQSRDVLAGDEFPALFISCTTLKDPASFDGRHHTIEAVTYCSHEALAPFAGLDAERSDEYRAFKTRVCDKFLVSLERVVPGIRTSIVHMELGTPLTNEHYIHSTHGSVFGTEKSFWQTGMFSFRLKSEIESLFLCGASVLAHGVAGATYSGIQTAAAVLGRPLNALLRHDPAQHVRIHDAERPDAWPEWVHRSRARRAVRREEASSD